jgi:hypothetical protein
MVEWECSANPREASELAPEAVHGDTLFGLLRAVNGV